MRVETQRLDSLTRDIAAAADTAERRLLVGPCAEQIARDACRATNGVWVQVPTGPDRFTATLFSIARGLPTKSVRQAATAVRRGGPVEAIEYLDHEFGDTPLFVGHVDALHDLDKIELGLAYRDEEHEMSRFLQKRAMVVTVDGLVPSSFRTWSSPNLEVSEAPLAVVNGSKWSLDGHWTALHGDLEHLSLVALDAVLNAELTTASEILAKSRLRARVWDTLPAGMRDLLALLDVHQRPVATRVLARAWARLTEGTPGSAQALIDRAREWRLVVEDPSGGLSRALDWSTLSRDPLGGDVALHRSLAESYNERFDLNSPDIDGHADDLLEAHRHWLGAGDVGRAAELARYGVEALVDHARTLSIRGGSLKDPELRSRAADLYAKVLEIDERAEHANVRLMGPHARAYATHYLHYNRAKSDRQPNMAETEVGYREAVGLWPEHAVFQSRLGLVLFYRNRVRDGLASLRAAEASVPSHRDKTRKLIARTVTRLLRHGRVLEALYVWGERDASSVAEGRDELSELLAAAAAGWDANELWSPNGAQVIFHERQRITVNRGRDWVASMDALRLVARGPTAVDAMTAVIERVREETRHLLTTRTGQLPPSDRMRKRQLLGVVDVVASELTPPLGTVAWVVGRVVWDDAADQYLLEAADLRGGRFALKDELVEFAASVPTDEYLLAGVARSAPGGPPVGPVETLEPMDDVTDQALNESLNRIIADQQG